MLALVLGGHALLLGDLPAGHAPSNSVPAVPVSVLQTRHIVAQPVAFSVPSTSADPVSVGSPAVVVKVSDLTVRPVRPVPAVLTRPVDVAADTAAARLARVAEPVLMAAAAGPSAESQASAASTSPASDGDEGVAVPVYATRLPPATRMQYELRRGALRGSGQLVWLPGEAAYDLSLEGSAFGAMLIGQSSRGGFDAAGMAPLRFLDRRRGRDAQAANFQRERNLITFSGPDTHLALLPGTQDRLSWMLQLPAIIEAGPARFAPGAQITLFVVGARGEGSVWTFEVVGREAIDLPAGPVTGALRLKREPRKPYDTAIEVWLDPARHHLPVRVRQAASQGGDATEFLLRSLGPP